MSHTRGPGPLPNRWLHCPRTSVNFIAEKFLAFKTPLSERYDSQMPPDCMFHPDQIFAYVKSTKRKLGLWIDLTNTKRFYDRAEVESNSCKYVKLQCRGHGETPSVEQARSFIEIVSNFISDRPVETIGIHCTHGFNRTGFLIVSFMVEEMDCSVEAALYAFSRARPPGIYKEDYLKELYRRYDCENDAPLAPQMPQWCLEYDDSHTDNPGNTAFSQLEDDDGVDDNDAAGSTAGGQNGDVAESTSSDSSPPKKKKKREFVRKNATFMAGVSGVTLFLEQPRLTELQQKVQKMCGWTNSGFPGCQPVSMDLNNLFFLQNKPYRVSWKADGTRYMMLIVKKDEIYFFDRDYSCFQVDHLQFPYRKKLLEHLRDTLIDGEMVIDKVDGKNVPRYLVYDIIKFRNEDVGKLSFYPNRLDCIKREIIAPRHEAIRQGLINRALEPFGVRDKEFWDINQSAYLVSPRFRQKLCHEPDGLIFQPSAEPYVPGPCEEVLKWKPVSMNSVDFMLSLSEERGVGILSKKIGLLYVGSLDVPFGRIKFTKAIKDLHKKIIECKFENNQWVFMRQRTDKSYPNSYSTAVAVCQSIEKPVTTDILLDFIHRHRFSDDLDITPSPLAVR